MKYGPQNPSSLLAAALSLYLLVGPGVKAEGSGGTGNDIPDNRVSFGFAEGTGAGGFVGYPEKLSLKPVKKASREELVKLAESYVGTVEKTGNNDGEVVEAFLSSVGLERGAPYCAAFVYFVYRESGYVNLVPRSGWSPDTVQNPTWTQAKGGELPKPGDPFGIYFASKGRVAHTGLVKKWGPQYVVTVEANTSPEAAAGSAKDRDGGGVWSKRRMTRTIYCTKNWLGNSR